MIEQAKDIIGYIPANLCEGSKGWYIYFYARDPQSGQLRRKRIKCNRIKNKRERKRVALKTIEKINVKLYNGWNPFVEQEASRSYTKLMEAIEIYLRNKKKELRPDSIRTYDSAMGIFKEWLRKNGKKDLFVMGFTMTMALEYMNYIFNERNVSQRTFNNILRLQRGLFNWMIENQYCKINHFVSIKMKKQPRKKRIVIPRETRLKITQYLEQNDKEYLVVCMLAFHALIRPKEISYLKIKYLDLEKQTIFIPGDISKNGNDRIATLPVYLVEKLKELDLNGNENYYLFSHGFKPGRIRVDSRKIAKRWDNLRFDLNIPKEMQFYSLRDSGIIQMLEDGISPEMVQKQADHHSLEVTSEYVKHARPDGIEEIRSSVESF